MAEHTSDCYDTVTDAGDWLVARCSCGWEFGPVPSWEEAADVLMDHVWDAATDAAAEPASAGER